MPAKLLNLISIKQLNIAKPVKGYGSSVILNSIPFNLGTDSFVISYLQIMDKYTENGINVTFCSHL